MLHYEGEKWQGIEVFSPPSLSISIPLFHTTEITILYNCFSIYAPLKHASFLFVLVICETPNIFFGLIFFKTSFLNRDEKYLVI